MTVSIKQHDRLPAMTSVLKSDNVPVDLTAAVSIRFIMTLQSGGSTKVAAAGAFTDRVNGAVSYSWGATDTDTAGLYNAEWEVTWPGSLLQTFPGDSYIQIEIRSDLA